MKVTCFALLFSVSCILAVAAVTLPDDLEEAFLQQALISEPGAKDIEDLEEQILRQATMNAEERKVATSTSKKDLEEAYLQQAKKDFEEVQLEQADLTCDDCEEFPDIDLASLGQRREVLLGQVNCLNGQIRRISSIGRRRSNPAPSCAKILRYIPAAPSGYYWIETGEGQATREYCDMTRSCGGVTGGWMRVAELDMTNRRQRCPRGLTEFTDSVSGIRTCVIDFEPAGCSSTSFPTSAVKYCKVCGKIVGYQIGTTNSFNASGRANISGVYVDGVGLTHGNPREHIWTFAVGLDDINSLPESNCPCTNNPNASDPRRPTPPPAFVGEDYFCEIGSYQMYQFGMFYAENPLWDGVACGGNSTACCSFNTPPWFFKQLPQPTTDDIEMRVCRDQERSNEDVAIQSIEIYVH